jgi:hypothetical protein
MGIQRRGHVSPGWPEPYVSVAIGTDANPPSPRPKSPETTAIYRMVTDGETTSGPRSRSRLAGSLPALAPVVVGGGRTVEADNLAITVMTAKQQRFSRNA